MPFEYRISVWEVSVQSALLTETNKIMEWFRVNYMKANPSKFKILTVGTDKKKDFKISIVHTDIRESENFVKLVGVYIDNQLTFDKHIHEMCVKAGRQLSLAPTRRFFLASGLCLSLPNISCVGLRQVKQRNELSHLAFLMRSTASLLLKHKHVYALLSSVVHRHRNISMLQRRFFKKKHSCGLVFSKLCYTPIFLIHIFSIK